jgi:serine/threonine protein kinase
MNLIPGQRIGAFILEEVLKRGGMALILRVRSPWNAMYAMKLSLIGHSAEWDEQNRIAIRGEAELLSQLSHQRIVRVIPIPRRGLEKAGYKYYANAYKMEGRPWYFVMEHLCGGNLTEHLKRSGPLTVPEATNIVGNVCLGLHFLHSKGLSHNDVKAENVAFRKPIRLNESFDPVLIDFGTAAGVKRYAEEAGTPYIMAPERIRVARGLVAPETGQHIDAWKAETWAVGVLLYQALSCKVPFPARRMRSLTSQIMNDAPVSLRKYNPQVPPELDTFVIEYCLCKDPAYRPSIVEVLKSLKPYGSGKVAAVSVPSRN